MRTVIYGGNLVTPYEVFQNYTLTIESDKIVLLEENKADNVDGDIILNARGLWVTPGLIDLHFHGSIGHDAMDATPSALHEMSLFLVQHGVTSYLPTTISANQEAILSAVENIGKCPQPEGGAHHLGVHIEGPYLNMAHRGAHPIDSLRLPNQEEYGVWFNSGAVRLVTVAPELDGATLMIEEGTARGIQFAIGHSCASYEQVLNAIDHGLNQATHVFNGMSGLHHRTPGVVGAVLTDDRIYAQVIADGVHLHPAIVKLLVRCKGARRTILITDAVCATGLGDGEYGMGSLTFTVAHGVARTSVGGLAGSTLTLEKALQNIISYTAIPFAETLQMATSTPAEALKLAGKKGVLAPGADADITLFDANLNVQLTIVAGCIVYRNEERAGELYGREQ